jgi:mannose-6-phosphate isomerase-like protein (cupin superfamily)
MSIFSDMHGRAAVARAAEAELVGKGPQKFQLLVDSSGAGGALSTVRVVLDRGADGAKPHHHTKSAEMFYVLDGSVQVLSGTDIVEASRGDLIVVPPLVAHAFAAARGHSAEMLIVIAPGIERFEYFRELERIRVGDKPPETLQQLQDLYDNHFVRSVEWEDARRR